MKFIKIFYVVFVAVLAVATFVEGFVSKQTAVENIYSAWWFVLLIALLVLPALYFVVKKLKKNIPALLVHLSFGLICFGALISFLTSEKGTLHLRQNEPENRFLLSDGRPAMLSQKLVLKDFSISTYPGTDTPMDFISTIETSYGETTVSMNKVLSVDGYRLYQSSFDYDKKGSIFMVNYDPYGIFITYSGYFLLFLSLILVLLNPKGRFRQLIKNLSVVVVMALLFSSCQKNNNVETKENVVSQEEAKEFSKVCVFYSGRIVPLNTYATDFCLKLTGKPKWKNLSSEQFLLSWLFYPEHWQNENVLRVKKSLPETAGVKVVDGYTSVRELYDENQKLKLAPFVTERPEKSVSEILDKLQLVISLTDGSALKIFPAKNGNNISWFSSSEDNIPNLTENEKRMTKEWVKISRLAIDSSDFQVLSLVPLQLARYQLKTVGQGIPSAQMRRLEIFYNRLRPTTWLYRLQLTFALLFLGFAIYYTVNGNGKIFSKVLFAFCVVFFVLQLVAFVLRGIISGTVPVSNGYETMLFLALAVLGVSFFIRKISDVLSAMCFLLSGFCLLVADISISNPNITPLMPVLHSPWLSLHVMSVMISYSLFTVVTLNAIVSQVVMKKHKQDVDRRFHDISLVLLYPAVVLLSVGIFIGAIWANESWGSYWSWDPKEVWALITLLVYAVPLHDKLVPGLQKTKNLNIYLFFAFLTVLMTYFGVNYLLGGMHSYA